MAENPLSGDELLAAGKGLASSIRATVESGRAYYLGRASREPSTPLSEVFNPETGPIIPFFVQVIRAVKRPPPLLAPWQSAAFGEFERECTDALDSMRRLTFELSPLLDAGDGRTAVGRSLKLSLCFFRIASGRLFRLLTRRRTFLRLLLRNHYNEGFGIYVANRFLNDIAKAFEVRERQLRGETAAPAHKFFASQFERIERRIVSEHERTRRDIVKWFMPRFKSRERGDEITQEQVARDLGVSRKTVNRWEMRQTANGPDNKSNKFGYYKELRTNPDLRGAYHELANCVRRYHTESRKASKTGHRFVTFVRFHEEWLKHRPYKM